MLIFPREYQHSGAPFRPKAVLEHLLRKVRNFSDLCVLGRKSAILPKKSAFLVPGIPFAAPSRKTLLNQCFFRCFGVHFPPFCVFLLNLRIFSPKSLLAPKVTFGAEKCAFFAFSAPKRSKTGPAQKPL